MSNYKKEISLNEKDSLQDMLNLEKNMVKVYSTAITEGTSKGFRNLVKENWLGTIDSQFDVFLLMTELGYAEVQSAPATTISEEKNKFSKIKSELA